MDSGALFEEHGSKILAFTHRLLGDRAESEDATQETFLRAHRAAASFDGRCSPSTWLFTIARNVCTDRLRARRPRSFDSLETVIARAGTGRDAGTEAERRWYVEAVREGCLLATLSCLTDDQRAAFVLRVLCGMSTPDTAVVLGRSENAVRVLTHRARHALKTFLCRNCSIYDPANACACENLVGFSLARGWIGPDDRRVSRRDAAVTAARAAAVIGDVARLAAVYASLDEPALSSVLARRITDRLRSPDAK